MSKKLKILGFASNLDLAKKGVSCTNGFLYEHLNSRGYVKSLVAPEIPKIVDRVILAKNISSNKTVWLFKNRISEQRALLKTKSIERKLKGFDFCSVNCSLQIGSEFDVSNSVKRMNIPMFSYHDNNIIAFMKTKHGLPVSKIKSMVDKIIEYEGKIYNGLDGIFTMTQYLRKIFIEDFKIPENKVHVIGVGCNLEATNHQSKDYSKKTILFVAKDSFDEKGGSDLINAFKYVRKEIPDCKLRIVGQKIRNTMDGMENIGFIDKTKPGGKDLMKQIYQEASLFVMPSYVEATGNVFIEAMANGLPCIGANLSAMPEIIVGNNCGFVSEPGNTKELAEKILYLLKDEKLMKDFGANGRIAVKHKYNWDVVCRRAVEIMGRYV